MMEVVGSDFGGFCLCYLMFRLELVVDEIL